jgi:hypothetical protein
VDRATAETTLSERREPAEIADDPDVLEADWKGLGGLKEGGLNTAGTGTLPPLLAERGGFDAGKSRCSYFFQKASVFSNSLYTA